MWELYLLTRIDFIVTAAAMILFVSAAISVYTLIYWIIESEIPDKIECIRKYNYIIGAISLITVMFTPTKEDLLLIYGLGPTIDYIQDNEKVKELPDKCVEALNKWVDSLDNKE
jgi:hypothetical protein